MAFFRRLSRTLAVTIRWSEDTLSKEEYASQFITLFFHFLFIKTIWKFVLRHVNLFSIMKSIRCCPFLFDVLCRLYKSWRQHPTRHPLYGHLPPIMKTIQVRRTRHTGHCWRSKDELVSDVLLWTPTYGQAKAGRPARTYLQQLCEDTGCNPEDLPEAMNDREKWREIVRDIRAGGTTWGWWWYNLQEFFFFFQMEFCRLNVRCAYYTQITIQKSKMV